MKSDFYKRLLEDASDVIWAMDTDGKFIYINEKIHEWGYNKDELIGESFLSILNTEHVGERFKKTFEEGVNEIYEMDILDKNGNTRKTVISTSPLRDDGGNIVGVMGIIKDVTENKRLQNKITDTERLAALGQLSLGIAHEIRNPLSSIKMNLQILNRLIPFTGETKEHFDLALREVFHLEGILDDLLCYAKPLKLRLKLLDVNSLLDDTLLLVKSDIRDKEIIVNRDYDNGLLKISLDEDKVKQAFLNIYLNSIQAMNQGGTLFIKTYREDQSDLQSSFQGERKVIIKVSDTGCGIEKDKLKFIFDPFFTTKPFGTGLGLSIVKNIFDHLGASIEVKSQPGSGTEFTVRLNLL
jgi:two-component system sensor histidine kinase HydH